MRSLEDVERTLHTPSRGQEDPVAAQLRATPTRSRRTAIRRSSATSRTGTYEEAILYIDEHVAAIDEVADRHPAFGVESLGTSTDKALDAEIKGGLAKAGLISIPLTTIVLLFILGSLVAALIPLLLGVTSVVATMGLLAIAREASPSARTSWRSSSWSGSRSASTTGSST